MNARLSLLFLGLLLTGCGANFTSIYRDYTPTSSNPTKIALIDAKQRAILAAPGNDVGGRKVFLCAEPSPDALSAISSSFSGNFGFTQPGTKVQAAMANAVTEAARQLGTRNATIQLLRDGLYRQCEAYMNGLINAETYDQIANKYINAMVTLLAIEQLTSAGSTTGESAASGGTKAGTNTNDNSPDEGNQPDPDANATDGDNSVSPGSASGDASAGAPVVGTNGPAAAASITKDVAVTTSQMVNAFLAKDTVDFCLYQIPRLAAKGTLPDQFVRMCLTILEKEHDSQLERAKDVNKALLNISDTLPEDKNGGTDDATEQ